MTEFRSAVAPDPLFGTSWRATKMVVQGGARTDVLSRRADLHAMLRIAGLLPRRPHLPNRGRCIIAYLSAGLYVSPAALGQNGQSFRAAVRRYAQDNRVPWVAFRKGDRNLDVMRPYPDAAERAGQSKVVAIGGGAGVPVGLRRHPQAGRGRGAVVQVLPH